MTQAAERDADTATKSRAAETKQAHSKIPAAIDQASKKRKLSQIVPTAAVGPLPSDGGALGDLPEEQILAGVSNDDLAEVKKSKKQKRKEEKEAQQQSLETVPEVRPDAQKTTQGARTSRESGVGRNPIGTDEAPEAHGSALTEVVGRSKPAAKAITDRPKRRLKQGKEPIVEDTAHDPASNDTQQTQRGLRAIQTIISETEIDDGLAPAWR